MTIKVDFCICCQYLISGTFSFVTNLGQKIGAGNQSFGAANALYGTDMPVPQAPKSPGVRQPSGFDPAAGKDIL